MKYISYIKNILPAALLLCLGAGMSSCSDDDLARGNGSETFDAVSLKIELTGQTSVSPMSRAEAVDFNRVNDLNIIVCNGDQVAKVLYLDAAALSGGTTTPAAGVTVTSTSPAETTTGYQLCTIDFDNSFWAGTPVKSCKFYAVANHGSKISETTLTAVKALRAADVLDVDNAHGSVSTPVAMYGEESGEPVSKVEDGKKIKEITIGLKRTVAMVTLKIDGANLNNDVVISLDSIVLRNVPASCTLGGNNTPSRAEYSTAIRRYGDFKGGNLISGGYRLVGKRFTVSGYGANDGFRQTLGGHYSPQSASGSDLTDVSDESVHPFFIYENMQGTQNQGNAQTDKRPTDANSWQNVDNYNQSGVCSYIVVYGKYTQYKGTTSDIAQRGTAEWRFFLGKNATDNFDVERNTNYRVTLTLSNTGIGEANSSWRVDTNLETPSVVGTNNNIVGGGGEMFCVQFPNTTADDLRHFKFQNVTQKDEYGNDIVGGFVYTFGSSSKPDDIDRCEWLAVRTGENKSFLTADGRQMWFYVSPFLPEDEGNKSQGNERTCSITFEPKNGTPVTVSFTQYRPVTFYITKDYLTQYPEDNDIKRACDILKTHYKHDVETDGNFTFYADRIDRDAMPWGFSGVQLDFNRNTGFENVYHLIKPLDGNRIPNCQTHIDYAEHYLPNGRGFRASTTNANVAKTGFEDYIDYSNGSCMVHAAMENYFQHFGDKPVKTFTPVTMLKLTLADVQRPDVSSESDRLYSWCVPSIVGYQLVEILDRFYKNHGITGYGFDSKHPVEKWTSYWTSNALTNSLGAMYPGLDPAVDGKHRSFVYQFDIGLDEKDYDLGITTSDATGVKYPAYLMMPRTASIKYRLLNIKPTSITTGTN